ncbi:hypothetical protein BH11MYX2_BH11MYX2_00300 [soil metagenome]
MRLALLLVLAGNAWVTTATLDGFYVALGDNRGNVFLRGGTNETDLGKLGEDGATITPVLVCTSTMLLGCAGLASLHTNKNGDLLLFHRDDIVGSEIYRVAAGSHEATEYVGMPSLDILAPTAFMVDDDDDDDDNAYLQYGANNGGAIYAYFLSAGSTSWEQGPEMPRPGMVFSVDKSGQAYAISSTSLQSYILD